MTTASSASANRRRALTVAGVSVVAAVVYWRTAYPTITWWDSSSYSAAAESMGLLSPPGSLLLTLLGWPISHLPLGLSPARILNLFAGLLAALTAGMTVMVALRMFRATSTAPGSEPGSAALLAAALGATAFAFTPTLWEHAIKFNPYVLTALFTTLILWVMVRWWEVAGEPGSERWLFALGLLFGLDFSVHRTNALLIPGALVWIMIRHRQVFTTRRAVGAGTLGMMAGLAVHLLVIPIARYTESPLNMWDPSTLSRFWSYVSLEYLSDGGGGNFLLNVLPRKSAFWSNQVGDLARTFADNFAHRGAFPVLGVLSTLVVIAGLVALFRRSRAMGAAWIVMLSLQAAATVIYFNIPADFFRPFDRHYLPIFVVCGITMSFGLAAITQQIASVRSATPALSFATAAGILLTSLQLVSNWSDRDASRRYFAADFARNALESLPRNAIYFTVGDNDTFPAIYMQHAEGVRPDVRIVNVGLSATEWHRDQIRRRDPSFPMGDYEGRLALPENSMLDIIDANQWRRPIAAATTLGTLIDPLKSQARLDGIHWRIFPPGGNDRDTSTLRANLLDAFEYRGYADSTVRIEPESRTMGFQYFGAFMQLLENGGAGRGPECESNVTRFIRAFPAERLNFGEGLNERLYTICPA